MIRPLLHLARSLPRLACPASRAVASPGRATWPCSGSWRCRCWRCWWWARSLRRRRLKLLSSASSLLALRQAKLGLQQLCFLAVHGHGGLGNVVLFTASGRGAKTGDEDTQKVKGDTMEDREMLSCSQLLVEEPRLEMKTHRRLKGTPWRTGKCCLVHSFW